MKKLLRRTWEFIRTYVPGVFLTVLLLDVLLLVLGTSVILAGALSGIAALVSMVLILFGCRPNKRLGIIRFFAVYSSPIDIVGTVIVTWIGFSMSVTLGLAALVIGLNLTGFLALMRWMNRLVSLRYQPAVRVLP